ncbi:MAG: hypothetical protein WCC06_00685 [Candidatus Aminicenantales bacterium]
MRLRMYLYLAVAFGLSFGLVFAQGQRPAEKTKTQATDFDPAVFKNLEWRNIGPANMVGRVADVEGVPGNPNIVYVGTASGGVWKTTNGGVTWKPIFDGQNIASIGDIALEPGNPDVIYVGTGESNVRNSVSFGNGVYKSTDGGETWKALGLEDTRHISRIIIHPKNPDIVIVGALGHAFGPNKERGVFMSTNGGKTWEKVLYIDDRHGVADMDIDCQNPNIVYAAFWCFERKPWTFTSGDENGGIYKSTDGGRTWKKLTTGLPKLVGRIGIKVSPSNPQVVYAITESSEGTLYRSDNRGENFRVVFKDRQIVSRGFYYTDLRIDPMDENRVYAVSSRLMVSIDGGKTFQSISQATHVDFHALWIDPENPNLIWQGQDGGIAVSYDRGQNWEYVNNIPAAQFYQIYADNREPFYYVGGGLQDNGTWYGPARNRDTNGILNDDWRMISFGDGFYIVVHPENPELFLSESQGGRIMRTNMVTGEQKSVSPQPQRADGGPASLLKYRFNWNAPIIPSPHDPRTVYFGANVVFRSRNFGTTWEVISPDLTTNDPEKQKNAGGPVWPENTTAEYHCTIISLTESPVQAGLLWAGTDDGNLQFSPDGGQRWQNMVKNILGVPAFSPVSHIEPSWTEAGAAYCSFDRHMLDDLRPYVFKTRDFGKSWTNITGNLPDKAYVWVVREDPENPNLIYAGTELGLFVSYIGGGDWQKLHLKNLPTVAVHDILIHPRDNDLILGTHGRSLWIFDDATPIQQMDENILARPAYLFDMRPALRYSTVSTRYGIGNAVFQGPNPPYGAVITYFLKEKPGKDKEVNLEILDGQGKVIRKLTRIPTEPGLNRAAWDLRSEGPRLRREMDIPKDSFFQAPRGPQVLSGTYRVRFYVGEEIFEKSLEVRLDPTLNASFENLKLAHEYALALLEMQSAANDGLRFLDGIHAQLEERKKAVQAFGKKERDEALAAIDQSIEQVESVQNMVSRPIGAFSWVEGPRLVERLSSLFRSIDESNTAPTLAEREYFGELKEEFKSTMGKVNEFLGKSVKELNATLQKHNVPPVLPSGTVKMPEVLSRERSIFP